MFNFRIIARLVCALLVTISAYCVFASSDPAEDQARLERQTQLLGQFRQALAALNRDEPAEPEPEIIACSICLEEVATEQTKLTCCGNLFCTVCLARWCKQRPTCPLCRAAVPQVIMAAFPGNARAPAPGNNDDRDDYYLRGWNQAARRAGNGLPNDGWGTY